MSMEISVNLTMGQHTNFGKALGLIYYRNKALHALAPNPSGYPHNGGEHSMSIRGPRDECCAFIELIGETYPKAAPDCKVLLDTIQAKPWMYAFRLRSLIPDPPNFLD